MAVKVLLAIIKIVTGILGVSYALVGGSGYESADDWAALLACFIILSNGHGNCRKRCGESRRQFWTWSELKNVGSGRAVSDYLWTFMWK